MTYNSFSRLFGISGFDSQTHEKGHKNYQLNKSLGLADGISNALCLMATLHLCSHRPVAESALKVIYTTLRAVATVSKRSKNTKHWM